MKNGPEQAHAYLKVRALLFARKWSRGNPSQVEWFSALERSGFLDFEAAADGAASKALTGADDVLTVAETFGGYDLPVLYAPSAAASLLLEQAGDIPAAARLLEDIRSGRDMEMPVEVLATEGLATEGSAAGGRAGEIFANTCLLAAAAELCGLGAALLIRVGAEVDDESKIADALMDVMLARAMVFGSAALAMAEDDTNVLVAGAYAAACSAATAAASVARDCVEEEASRTIVVSLEARYARLLRLNAAPDVYHTNFSRWCAEQKITKALCTKLYQSAGTQLCTSEKGFHPPGNIIPPEILQLVEDSLALRVLSARISPEISPGYHVRHSEINRDLLGLVCAEAQRQAGDVIKPSFIDAAARRIRQRLTDCTRLFSGTGSGNQKGGGEVAQALIDPHS